MCDDAHYLGTSVKHLDTSAKVVIVEQLREITEAIEHLDQLTIGEALITLSGAILDCKGVITTLEKLRTVVWKVKSVDIPPAPVEGCIEGDIPVQRWAEAIQARITNCLIWYRM